MRQTVSLSAIPEFSIHLTLLGTVVQAMTDDGLAGSSM